MALQLSIKHLHLVLVAFIVSITLAGCGGSSSAVSEPVAVIPVAPQSATVTLLLTDAPSDQFDSIYVTITSVELLGGSERVVLFDGEETIDLLMLENFSDLFAINNDVPADTYSKIRLRITDLELVRLDDAGNVIESVHPDLPANGKLDLNPRGPINIEPGENVVLQLDMDARRSIHIVGTGNGRYRFRPVIFIDVIDDNFDGKAVRINGEVVALNESERTIEICQQHPSSSDKNGGNNDGQCVIVNTNDQTGFFNNDANDAAFAQLLVGDTVVVIGMYALDDRSMFDATVVAVTTNGEFGQYEGVVQTAVDANNEFILLLDSGQGFAADSEITVRLLPGTGLADDDGNSLAADAIQPDIEAEIDGLLLLSNSDPDVLRAIYGALELDSDDGSPDDDDENEIRVSGQVLTVDDSTDSLYIATENGDRCLVLEEHADIFLITNTTDGSTTESIELADVAIDASVDAYGEELIDGCFEVDSLLVFN